MGGTQIYNLKIKSVIHDYEVHFTDDFSVSINEELQEGDFLILDRNILRLYPQELKKLVLQFNTIVIDATEQQKSYEGIIPIIRTLIHDGFRKNHRLVAIGGGITQDITAFIASIMYRGVRWLFFPTTLLAQGDSCIGSKTSINFGEFKNQVGGFYPPNKIIIYPEFIDSLAEKEMKSGMGEMLHYFVVSGEEDFRMYESTFQDAFSNRDVLARIVARSLEIKKSYIERDEFDQNIRQVFNYGHSFGHAIESLTKYSVPHGIAVSYGMDIANFMSVKMGLISEDIRTEIRNVAKTIWSGFPLNDIDVDAFIQALSKDKKNVGNQLGLILNKGYGQIFKQLVDADDRLVDTMNQYFDNELDV
jgi:3-dehydroquinate synthase